MITSRRIPLWLASAAAALAISFSATAADLSATPKTADQAQPTRTAMPVPKARPLVVRKRVAVRYRARLLSARPWTARPAYLLPPAPVARVASAWPMLMLGIGY
jgi:hypothetical protein